jgi:hypothetical protein
VVVVPSAMRHLHSQCGGGPHDPSDRIEGPGAAAAPHMAYWAQLQRFVARLGSKRSHPPLVVVHVDGSWQESYNDWLLYALAEQPAEFVSRVVLVSFENALELPVHPQNQMVFRATGVAPTFLVVPFVILTDGILAPTGAAGDAGIKRTVSTSPSRRGASTGRIASLQGDDDSQAGQRPVIALFMGRPKASQDGARLKTLQLMMAAGAVCDSDVKNWGKDDTVICAVCRQPNVCGRILNESKALCRDGWSPTNGVQCAPRTFALAASATFCIETDSDSNIRSHLYVAMISGCIPVIFDGLGPYNTDGETECRNGVEACATAYERPMQWASRQPQLIALLRSIAGTTDAVQNLNYSRFALIYSSPQLLRGMLDHVVAELIALASTKTHRHRLRRLQRGLLHAAPFVRFANPTWESACEMEPCDAFSVAASIVRGIVTAVRDAAQLEGKQASRHITRLLSTLHMGGGGAP